MATQEQTNQILTLSERVETLVAELRCLQAENERLRETLAVFADERSWWQFDTSKDPQTLSMEYKWRSKDNPIEFAQQALEPKE